MHKILWICLIHWGRVTHICVGKLTIIGSDNGLSPGRRQAIIWTNAGILLIRPLGTNFREILIGIQTFSFRKMHLKISSVKLRSFCFGLNDLILVWFIDWTHSKFHFLVRKVSPLFIAIELQEYILALSEPIMVSLLTHICVTEPPTVKTTQHTWRQLNCLSGGLYRKSERV